MVLATNARSLSKNTPKEVILQDLGPPISHALPIPGVKAEVCDFFTPQVVRDADFYYLKACLHN